MRFDLVTHDPDALFSIIASSSNGIKPYLRPTMLYAGNHHSSMTLGLWLLRGPSRREVLLTSTTHARMPRLLV